MLFIGSRPRKIDISDYKIPSPRTAVYIRKCKQTYSQQNILSWF